ncbi:biopolymer transporter ExbD [Nannocystis pusilla]|uniref:Biopolymer transporter ExbD n=1 Tax=Nannocystis pusilla TaxID=889268 RepID=A0ABS7TKP5_9BACT|nr:biopolymer transporter ExbD [Nannocystis pusilla]MBZ5708776.1 biopolymer transporter ExbD [Nannocystis pusilla]
MSPEQEAFLAKKKEKAAARRAKPEEKGELGMTSLMDIVSILVVYLLKSYASDPIVINPTAGQKIPMSSADAPVQDGVPIFVTTRGITFDNKKIVTMTPDGDIDPSQVQNHLIGPLYDQLAEEVDKAKQLAERTNKPWNARVILVGDQDLKFSVLVDVMYTTGRAEFAEYSFCVIRKS